LSIPANPSYEAAHARAMSNIWDPVLQALVRMSDITVSLPPTDGVRRFNDLYRAVTQDVYDGRGDFQDPDFIATLTDEFARLYFEAYDAPTKPGAWRPLFDARWDSRLATIQHVLAGMNAHINRDLAIALVRTLESLGRPWPAPASTAHADYLHINALLKANIDGAQDQYGNELTQSADEALGQLDELVKLWSLTAARDVAWSNGNVLRYTTDALRPFFVAGLDSLAGLSSRALLVPIPGLGLP
jgi:hypothetical protein